MKEKKNSILVYMNPKNLRSQVNKYGGRFSVFKFFKYLLLLYGIAVGLLLIFKVHTAYAAGVLIAITIFLPDMFVSQFKRVFEIRRFEDISAYMEQMLYSFKRRNKILSALEDTLSIFAENKQGAIYQSIESAIECIKTEKDSNIYEKAFTYIEDSHGCNRLRKLHRFLINVENSGGDCERSVDILLDDRNLWVDRMNLLQRERKNIKVKTLIGLGMSFLVCGMAVYMLPKDFDVTALAASQIVTSIALLGNFLVWYFVDKKMSGAILGEETDYDWQAVKRSYDHIFHEDAKGKKKKQLIISGILLACVFAGYVMLGIQGAVIFAVLLVLALTNNKRRYKLAFAKVKKEVEKAFPEWLMHLSLKLQSDNLFVAMSETVADAPMILQEELNNLLEKLAVEPDSLEPFMGFMNKLYLPDVTSAMRMLYSLGAYGSADREEQIAALNKRNITLMDRAETLRMEDRLMGVGMLVLAPMLTGVLKMITDLALMVTLITDMSNLM